MSNVAIEFAFTEPEEASYVKSVPINLSLPIVATGMKSLVTGCSDPIPPIKWL